MRILMDSKKKEISQDPAITSLIQNKLIIKGIDAIKRTCVFHFQTFSENSVEPCGAVPWLSKPLNQLPPPVQRSVKNFIKTINLLIGNNNPQEGARARRSWKNFKIQITQTGIQMWPPIRATAYTQSIYDTKSTVKTTTKLGCCFYCSVNVFILQLTLLFDEGKNGKHLYCDVFFSKI